MSYKKGRSFEYRVMEALRGIYREEDGFVVARSYASKFPDVTVSRGGRAHAIVECRFAGDGKPYVARHELNRLVTRAVETDCLPLLATNPGNRMRIVNVLTQEALVG